MRLVDNGCIQLSTSARSDWLGDLGITFREVVPTKEQHRAFVAALKSNPSPIPWPHNIISLEAYEYLRNAVTQEADPDEA
jgi:hypothetical protein